jgi:hypothetical protein
MTRPMMIPLAVFVLVSNFALAQEPGKRDGIKQEHPQTWGASTKALTVSGKVSDDGKRFISDIDTEWAIHNPDALKGRAGSLVTIKCYVDSDQNLIHVLSIRTSAQYTATYADSAFRR